MSGRKWKRPGQLRIRSREFLVFHFKPSGNVIFEFSEGSNTSWPRLSLPVQRRTGSSRRYGGSGGHGIISCNRHRGTGVFVAAGDITRRIRWAVQAGRPPAAAAAERWRWSRVRRAAAPAAIRWAVGRVWSSESPARWWSRWWRQHWHLFDLSRKICWIWAKEKEKKKETEYAWERCHLVALWGKDQ